MYNDGRYPIIEAVNTTFLFKLSISKDQQETRLVSFFSILMVSFFTVTKIKVHTSGLKVFNLIFLIEYF